MLKSFFPCTAGNLYHTVSIEINRCHMLSYCDDTLLLENPVF